jgi:hypothetical protein
VRKVLYFLKWEVLSPTLPAWEDLRNLGSRTRSPRSPLESLRGRQLDTGKEQDCLHRLGEDDREEALPGRGWWLPRVLC